MKLTQRAVAALALPRGKKDHIEPDDEIRGFGFRLRASGSRTWTFQYQLGAKQRRMSLGSYPAIAPAQARVTAANLHAAVRLGRDPAGEKAESRARAGETFRAALTQFLSRKKAQLKPRSYLEIERHLVVHAKPLHSFPLAAIGRREVAALLSGLATNHTSRVADSVRTSLMTFLGWAMREGLLETNPVLGTNVNVSAADRVRDRVLSPNEVNLLWAILADDQYGSIVKLLLLTAQRRDEIAGVTWQEIDTEAATLTLPPWRTKNKRAHVVPLSARALAIFNAQPRRLLASGKPRDNVFGTGSGGFSGWSKAKAQLDSRLKAANRSKPSKPWRLHDLRRTAATNMAELGVLPHVIEAALNHVSGHKSGVAGVYNHARYDREVRAALELWAEHVISIVQAQKTSQGD
jgi:integrase